MTASYDTIGEGYAKRRQADPRLAALINAAVGDVNSVLNVGAGAGSYEPTGNRVVAVEPSAVMIAQRSPDAAPAVRALAEALPFSDGAFDAVLAILTIHHWRDPRRGLAECARVARRKIVLFTWDPSSSGFWLEHDYFPELLALDRSIFPQLAMIASVLGTVESRAVPIPGDCIDGFLGSYWRRPEAYLDPHVRSGISSFSRIGDVEPGLAKLRADVASGAWRQRYSALVDLAELDIGYRLLVADVSRDQIP